MFRITLISFLVLLSASFGMDKKAKKNNDDDYFNTPKDTINLLAEPRRYDWTNGLDSSQAYEIVDSLVAIAQQVFPFREGEFDEWRDWLYEVRWMGSTGSLAYKGPQFVRIGGASRRGSSIISGRGGKFAIEIIPPPEPVPDDTAAKHDSTGFFKLSSDVNANSQTKRIERNYNYVVEVTNVGEDQYNLRYESDRSNGDTCYFGMLAKALSELQHPKGIILDFRGLPPIASPDSVEQLISLFTLEPLFGLLKETRDGSTGYISREQSAIAANPKAFTGPLVVILGWSTASQTIGAVLQNRPLTSVIKIHDPHGGYESNTFVVDADTFNLPLGFSACVPTSVYRKPLSDEFASIAGSAWSMTCGCFGPCPHRKQIAENKEKPLKELKQLLRQQRGFMYSGI